MPTRHSRKATPMHSLQFTAE
ncbi:MAG: hypothetical protein QOJ37_4161, partial [Pseudonocardiales bacterium]|nr:hypothetical protein [Pseudonocardiales bacterium]